MTWGDEEWAREYQEKHKGDLSFRLLGRLPMWGLDLVLLVVLALIVVWLFAVAWVLGKAGL